nr:hypothetical protein CFP56_71802 [Quercus suber]
MIEGEELLGSGDASIARVVVTKSEATIGGVAEAVAGGDEVEVRLGEPLLPLQDPWYCSSSLFPVVRVPKVKQEIADKGFCQILKDAKIFEAVVLSNGWNMYRDFGVQFILDKIRVAVEACIARDDEFTVKIADLEREIATKRAELSFLLSQ